MVNSVKKVNQLAYGSIKKINALAIASAKKISWVDSVASGNWLLTNLSAYYAMWGLSSAWETSSTGRYSLTKSWTVWSQTGKNGNARWAFAAATDYLSTSAWPIFEEDIACSISAWIYFDSAPANFATFVSVWGQNSWDWKLELRVDNASHFQLNMEKNQVAWNQATWWSTFTTGVWYHIVWTYDWTGNGKLYVNAWTAVTWTYGSSWASNDNEICIWWSLYDWSWGYVTNSATNSRVDEVGIWNNRVLSLTDVSNLYNAWTWLFYASFDVPTTNWLLTNLRGYYALESNSNDSSWNARHGTDVNTPTFSSGNWKNANGAGYVKASSERSDLPNSIIPRATQAFSVNIWFKRDATANTQYVLFWSQTTWSWSGWFYIAYWLDAAWKLSANFVNRASSNPQYTRTQDTNRHMLTYVARTSGTRHELYLDWASVATDTGTNTVIDSANPVAIAARHIGTPDFYYDGAVDEVWVRDRSLSSGDVTNLYNAGPWLFYASFN